MKKIGITGAQGSGKTFIAMYFAALKVPVLIIDEVIKQLQSTNKEVINKIKKRFPNSYENDAIDHDFMVKKLFWDKSGNNLKDLANILRPYILQEFNKFCEEYSNKKFVLVESALIYEYGVEDLFDEIIFVKSDQKTRKKMAMLRDNISSDEYSRRMKSQLPDQYKIQKSKWIIENNYTDSVFEQVKKINELI